MGRRFNETLDPHTGITPKTAWSVMFTGQRKSRFKGELTFEIPTLVPASQVLAAIERMRAKMGGDGLTDTQRANRYGRKVSRMADLHFRALIPPDGLAAPDEREDTKNDRCSVYFMLFRAVYATIAVHYFCPPRISLQTYKSEIQGHRELFEGSTPQMRRSYRSRRYYDYYQIATADGTNIDGRQGIRLEQNIPGLELLEVFQPHDNEGISVEMIDGLQPHDNELVIRFVDTNHHYDPSVKERIPIPCLQPATETADSMNTPPPTAPAPAA